jgi:hypothetical protein
LKKFIIVIAILIASATLWTHAHPSPITSISKPKEKKITLAGTQRVTICSGFGLAGPIYEGNHFEKCQDICVDYIIYDNEQSKVFPARECNPDEKPFNYIKERKMNDN